MLITLLIIEERRSLLRNILDNGHVVYLSGDEPFPPGSEPGELGELRGRLLFLLETSKHYQAQHLLTHFPESESSHFLTIENLEPFFKDLLCEK